jgi:SAM-dependent methyltransferase
VTEKDLLYADPALVDFYDIENDGRDDFDFCLGMAEHAGSVLDLGCGTGQFLTMAGGGRRRVGVDPAASMLEVARGREGGTEIRWVEGDARSVRLGETFDLITMTGHAFQCFLTDADVSAALRTIAAHLAPAGRFIFDSRNPSREEWREWVPGESDRMVSHPRFGALKAWNDVAFDPASGIATYDTFYQLPDGGARLHAASKIRFVSRERLETLIAGAGLAVERWLGDWHGGAYRDDAKEIIPVGGRAVG